MSIITEALKKAEAIGPGARADRAALLKNGGMRDNKYTRRRIPSLVSIVLTISISSFLTSLAVYFLFKYSIQPYLREAALEKRKLAALEAPVTEKPTVREDQALEASGTREGSEEPAKPAAGTAQQPIKFAEAVRYVPARPHEMVDLNGIMYTPDMPLAIINGRILAEGNSFGDYKIMQIGKDFVRLRSAEEEFIIRLQR